VRQLAPSTAGVTARTRIPNCDERGTVCGIKDVATSSGAERENRTGVWPAYGRWKANCCVGC